MKNSDHTFKDIVIFKTLVYDWPFYDILFLFKFLKTYFLVYELNYDYE